MSTRVTFFRPDARVILVAKQTGLFEITVIGSPGVTNTLLFLKVQGEITYPCTGWRPLSNTGQLLESADGQSVIAGPNKGVVATSNQRPFKLSKLHWRSWLQRCNHGLWLPGGDKVFYFRME